ncbi:MAG: lysophospholipid acyltransferase family protein [Chthoniobacteraceae bacterium]|jgi:1-acyl-sn-glycerol-3-phosphate acyltransferase
MNLLRRRDESTRPDDKTGYPGSKKAFSASAERDLCWRNFPAASSLRRVRVLIYHVSRLIVKMLVAPFVKINVLRPGLGRRKGAWILASNHISHFDPPLIGVAIRRKIDWMAMVELFRQPIFAAWMRAIDAYPVDRARLDRQAVRTSLERLRQGHAVGMFPEGGIRDGAGSVLEGAPLRPGVAGLAQITDAPVIPCVIMGSDRCYVLPWIWRPWRRVPVWIAFGEPLHPGTGERAAARAALEARLAEAFRQLALEMRRHFQLSEDDLPQSPVKRRAAVA